MSTSVLVGFATRYGSTEEVAKAIAETLREGGHAVTLLPLREVKSLEGCWAVVMGRRCSCSTGIKRRCPFLRSTRRHFWNGAQRSSHWDRCTSHTTRLNEDSQVQLEKELGKHPWFNPIEVKMFGGKYEPAKLGFPLKMFAGETPASDIRDWQAIRAWAESLGKLFGQGE